MEFFEKPNDGRPLLGPAKINRRGIFFTYLAGVVVVLAVEVVVLMVLVLVVGLQ